VDAFISSKIHTKFDSGVFPGKFFAEFDEDGIGKMIDCPHGQGQLISMEQHRLD
jgi:hypothetical protein